MYEYICCVLVRFIFLTYHAYMLYFDYRKQSKPVFAEAFFVCELQRVQVRVHYMYAFIMHKPVIFFEYFCPMVSNGAISLPCVMQVYC